MPVDLSLIIVILIYTLFFSKINPSKVKSPDMVILNDQLAHSLNLDFSHMTSKEQSLLFSGNMLSDKMDPFAQAYAGHQFEYFTMLGWACSYIGRTSIARCVAGGYSVWGSGRTAYLDRVTDVVGPMLWYIISEAMYSLNIHNT